MYKKHKVTIYLDSDHLGNVDYSVQVNGEYITDGLSYLPGVNQWASSIPILEFEFIDGSYPWVFDLMIAGLKDVKKWYEKYLEELEKKEAEKEKSTN